MQSNNHTAAVCGDPFRVRLAADLAEDVGHFLAAADLEDACHEDRQMAAEHAAWGSQILKCLNESGRIEPANVEASRYFVGFLKSAVEIACREERWLAMAGYGALLAKLDV